MNFAWGSSDSAQWKTCSLSIDIMLEFNNNAYKLNILICSLFQPFLSTFRPAHDNDNINKTLQNAALCVRNKFYILSYQHHAAWPHTPYSINNAELPSDVSDVKLVKDSRDGLYDVKVVARLPRNTLKPDTIINCQLSIPKTDYKKNQKTVYFGEYMIMWWNWKIHLQMIENFNLKSEKWLTKSKQSPLDSMGAWSILLLSLFCFRHIKLFNTAEY